MAKALAELHELTTAGWAPLGVPKASTLKGKSQAEAVLSKPLQRLSPPMPFFFFEASWPYAPSPVNRRWS